MREITVRKDGLADGVIYYDTNDQVHEQKARLVVLACNGIGTPSAAQLPLAPVPRWAG